MTDRDILECAISSYGKHAQIRQAVEELGELIVAIAKYKRGSVGEDAVIDEIADVRIMAMQLSLIFGEDDVKDRIVYKLNRLNERLEKKGV